MQWFVIDDDLPALRGSPRFDDNAGEDVAIVLLHAIAGSVMELLGRMFWLGLAALLVRTEFFG